MKQKYIIEKTDKKANIAISEFVELGSNEYSSLSEQTYKFSEVKKAMNDGRDTLIKTLRSSNFFPPIITMEKIVTAIEALLSDSNKKSIEVIVDDVQVMNDAEAEVEEPEEETDIDDLDEILTDDEEALPDVKEDKKD